MERKISSSFAKAAFFVFWLAAAVILATGAAAIAQTSGGIVETDLGEPQPGQAASGVSPAGQAASGDASAQGAGQGGAGQEGAAQGRAVQGESGQGGAAQEGAPQGDSALVQAPGQSADSLAAPLTLSSQPQSSSSLPSLIPQGLSLVKFIGAFIAVLALLLICLKLISWLARGGRPSKSGRAFTMRGTMALDSRRYLAAVEVDGHLLVVGVTNDRLTALASWPMEDDGFDGPSLVDPKRSQDRGKFPRAVDPRPVKAAPSEGDGPSFLEKRPSAPPAAAPGQAQIQAPVQPPPPGSPIDSAPKPASKSGRDAPDFTLALEDEPFEGSQANDPFKLDLDRE